jgi:hypothetical protein
MLTVVWHLLCNGELYVEDGFSKAAVFVRSTKYAIGNGGDCGGLSLDEMAGVLGCVVKVVSDDG